MSIGDMKIFNPIPDFHQEMLGPIANSAYTHFVKDGIRNGCNNIILSGIDARSRNIKNNI